jgi:hypothetical protein
MKRTIEVFICYSSEDEQMLQELMKQLKVLQQQGVITIWHQRSIKAGTEWKREIDLHLNQAELILLLISPDFMNSDYCYSVEMMRAMQRHRQGDACVIPIILRPVHWQGAPFAELQVLPKGAIPIANEKWHHPDDAYYNVVEGIIEMLRAKNLLDAEPQLPELIPPQKDRRRKAFTLKSIEKQHLRTYATAIIPTITPLITIMLFLVLLFTVLFQNGWCPGLICTPTQPKSAIHPDEISDQNLYVAYLHLQQTTSFELPGAPGQYTLQNLPRTVAAVKSDGEQQAPYRLVITVRNLHQTGYEIYIDSVTLLVYAVPRLANPLNVWNTSSLSYNTTIYKVTYAGEPARSVLSAALQPPGSGSSSTLNQSPHFTGIHQRLPPGEQDEIGLQIDPAYNLQADLQFQVRITYHMANENSTHALTLPNLFEVVFSNASNWHVYSF